MTEFKLPELGENIDQGDLVRLMISLGASVTEGQPVMELETDKAVVEVPSSVSGTVKDIRVKEGEKIKVGQVIFTVENGAGAQAKAVEAQAAKAAKTPAAKAPAEKPAPSSRRRRAAQASSRIRSRSGRVWRRLNSGCPSLGENIDQGDLVQADGFSGRQSFRRPAGHGTGNRQGRGRGAILGDGHGQRYPGQGRPENQSRTGDLHPGGRYVGAPEKAKHAPVEHISGQHEARLSFRRRFRPKEKLTHRFSCRTSRSRRHPKRFAMPAQLGKVAGTEHRAPAPAAPHVRRLARELGVDIHDVKGSGPGRTHQRR